jgi:hypothetical protein
MDNTNTAKQLPEPVWQRSLLAGVLFLALTSRLYQLDHYSLWADEVWGLLDCAKGSWLALLSRLIYSDNHPPGYESFLYVWIKLFGNSDYSVRLPSVFTGFAAVIAIYQSGNQHFKRYTGLLAACLLAGSFQAIYYSQEARAYSPLLLACLLNTHAFLALAVDTSEKKSDAWLFWTSGVAMLYLHYTGSIFFASEVLVFLFIWLQSPTKKTAFIGVRIFLPVLLLYAPWLPTMYSHANVIDSYWAAKPTFGSFLHLWIFLLGPGNGLLVMQLTCLAAAAMLLVRDACVSTEPPITQDTKTINRKTAILFALLLLPMAIFFTKSYYTQSIHEERHFIYGIPLICLLVAQYISRMANHLDNKTSLAALIAVITTVLAFEQYRSNTEHNLYNLNDKQEIREGSGVIVHDKAFINSKDIILSSHEFFLHYLQRNQVRNSYLCCFNDTTPANEIKKFIENKKTRTFYFIEIILPDQPMLGILQSQYEQLCTRELNMVRVSKFRADKPAINKSFIPVCPL